MVSDKIIKNIIIGVLSLMALVLLMKIINPVPGRVDSGLEPPDAKASLSVKDLLGSNPGSGASEEDIREYSVKVSSVAVQSGVLNVKNCEPSPSVMHLKLKQSVTIENTDSVAHRIYHASGIDLSIPPRSNKTYTLKFPNPGIFGYACDGKLPGIFFVTPD